MTVVIPFCAKDLSLTADLLDWIDDLGGCRKYPCVLVADCKLDAAEVAPVRKSAKLVFKSVTVVSTPYNIKLSKTGDTPWPVGPNWMFYCAAMYLGMTGAEPWLWLEPDCVPLCPGWLEKIETEYLLKQKPFLGPVIETQNKSFKPQYLNGTSVYPGNALRYFHGPLVDFLKGAGNAFDVAGSGQTVPNAHFTALIQHGYTDSRGINHWGTHPNVPLVFKEHREPHDDENVVTPQVIQPEAVLFHPCKNGSLIDLLRKPKERVKVAA